MVYPSALPRRLPAKSRTVWLRSPELPEVPESPERPDSPAPLAPRPPSSSPAPLPPEEASNGEVGTDGHGQGQWFGAAFGMTHVEG